MGSADHTRPAVELSFSRAVTCTSPAVILIRLCSKISPTNGLFRSWATVLPPHGQGYMMAGVAPHRAAPQGGGSLRCGPLCQQHTIMLEGPCRHNLPTPSSFRRSPCPHYRPTNSWRSPLDSRSSGGQPGGGVHRLHPFHRGQPCGPRLPRIIQIPTYIDRIRRGHIVPQAPFQIVKETPATTVIDGHWGFGYVVSERAMQITIEKARGSGVAAATVFRQSHVGRLADYPIMAAEADMIGLMTADSGRSSKSVAPFGGREPRLGTNPICIGRAQQSGGPAVHRHGHQCGGGRQDQPGPPLGEHPFPKGGSWTWREIPPPTRPPYAKAAPNCRWEALKGTRAMACR